MDSVFLRGKLLEGEVGEAGHAVFDFHWEGLSGNHGSTVFENFAQSGRTHSVVVVVGNPDLEKALALMSDGASAVDKVLFSKGDFGDVEVRRNGFAIREVDGERLIGNVGKLGL